MMPIPAVVGPTASGKTALAMALAEELDGEIISADSMQIYRGMEIGTAAPAPEEQRRVKHHFVGMLEPDQFYSAGIFQCDARRVITELESQGKTPVITGGSGLYVRALVDGLFSGPARDADLQRGLFEEARQFGMEPLFDRLRAVDPEYAARIKAQDLRRIVRGLEVYEVTGRRLSDFHEKHQAAHESLPMIQVALDYPREILYARINERVERMIAAGFIDEVERLLEKGYEPQLMRLRSLGYREFIAHLRGELTLEEAIAGMKQATRRFAKRQLTWFRGDPRVHWLATDGTHDTAAQVREIQTLLAATESA